MSAKNGSVVSLVIFHGNGHSFWPSESPPQQQAQLHLNLEYSLSIYLGSSASVSHFAMTVCPSSSSFDFRDPCIRIAWASLPPFIFVLVLVLASIPFTIPPGPYQKLFSAIKAPFRSYLTLAEAEALDSDVSDNELPSTLGKDVAQPAAIRRTLILSFVGLLQALIWLSIGSYNIVVQESHGFLMVLISLTWLFAALYPTTHPVTTLPYLLFTIYITHLIGAVILLGGVFWDSSVEGLPFHSGSAFGLEVNLVAVAAVLGVVCGMPVGVPSKRVKSEDIGRRVSPEDYTSLWGWITFSWVWPLVKKVCLHLDRDISNVNSI
jgi:hypothetical protein